MRRTTLGLLLALTSTTVLACASQASVVRPKEGTAGDATGEKACDPKRVSGDSEPFAVDWSDTNRAALESAMQRGVAVVKYSCEGVEVLKGCSLAGDYAYRGMSKKTKLVQMKDMSAVAANFGPTTLPVAVQAELKQGKGPHLPYVMDGAESTTVQTVSPDMLKGRCDGANTLRLRGEPGCLRARYQRLGRGQGRRAGTRSGWAQRRGFQLEVHAHHRRGRRGLREGHRRRPREDRGLQSRGSRDLVRDRERGHQDLGREQVGGTGRAHVSAGLLLRGRRV